MNTPGMFSENLSQSMALNTDVEDYLEMISKLILENSSLKSEYLKSKLNVLHSSMPQFSKCMERYNLGINKEHAFIGLTDDEQAKMSNTIQKVRDIEKVKKKLDYSMIDCQAQIMR
jgi:Mn-dependent DtxR family transcriptional regulator